MWETLKNAWKIPDLRKKILYTLMMLVIYRLMCFVPVPGVDKATVAARLASSGVSGLLDFIGTMTGSQMSDFAIMAMGITPYINASIIMQLLAVAIPKLEEMQKEGEEGRKKIAKITRYVTIGLGFLQATALSISLRAAVNGAWYSYIEIGLCLAAGTALAMWIGERINENGIGNGVSLLIFAGIISRISMQIVGYIRSAAAGVSPIWHFVPVLVISLAMIVGVTLVDLAERRIPVQYAKRMVGRKLYGGQSTHIPLKVNASGVLPLIFASAIMQFPSIIMSLFGENNRELTWWNKYFAYTSGWYLIVFAVLVFAFTFFYSSITFNPVDISKRIQENGGLIPGIRQGKPTADFIAKITRRITLFGALFLAVLAILPTLLYNILGISIPLAASSLLIAVSVAIETVRQLESQMTLRHYKGFLK